MSLEILEMMLRRRLRAACSVDQCLFRTADRSERALPTVVLFLCFATIPAITSSEQRSLAINLLCARGSYFFFSPLNSPFQDFVISSCLFMIEM